MKQVAIYGVSDDLIEVEVSDESGEVTERREYNTESGRFVFIAQHGSKLTVTVEYGDEEWEISTKITTDTRAKGDDSFTVRHGGRADRLSDPMIVVIIQDELGEEWSTDLTED